MQNRLTLLIFLVTYTILFSQKQVKLDATFGNNGSVLTSVQRGDSPIDIIVQRDGKILAAGGTSDTFPGPISMVLIRYNADGSLDNTFGEKGVVLTPFGKAQAYIWKIAIQNDGKIVVGGNADKSFALARYNTNGTLDTSFNKEGKVTTTFKDGLESVISALLIQDDGKIIAAGRNYTKGFLSGGRYSYASFVTVRYLPNGALDTTFNKTGIIDFSVDTSTNSIWPRNIFVQNDNKIIVGSQITNLVAKQGYLTDALLVRYSNNGALDKTFGDKGIIGTSKINVSSIKILDNDKFLFSGTLRTDSLFIHGLYRYQLKDGLPDLTFGTNGKVEAFVSGDILLQKDGKILLSGNNYYNQNEWFMQRFDEDGVVDEAFGLAGRISARYEYRKEYHVKTILQDDNKLLALGASYDNDKSNFKVKRYEADLGIGVNNVKRKEDPFVIFPNPTTGELNIYFKEPITAASNVIIFDRIGRIVYQNTYNASLSNSNLRLDLSTFTTGLYVVRMVYNGTELSQKIVKY
jgi:uncharacterized delta-60 repeat protein